jgi:hypothetical protein
MVFLGAGILACVIIPGLLVFRTEGEDERPSDFAVWDQVLDYIGKN